jgi:hypothetical protein
MAQGDLLAIPTLDATEREVLLSTARQFNLCRVETTAGTQPQTPPGPPSVRRGDRPGDHFNARMTWAALLQKHGWRIERIDGVTTYWSRPGKERGVSASTNYGDCDLLYVFSTNAAPFDHERAYDKFGAYALLEHGGDFSAASRALALAGYGALSLAQVVGLVVPLTKGRGYLAGACPFCGCRDKLGVFPREDFFRCFACGVQGNAASFRALLSTQLRAQRRGG